MSTIEIHKSHFPLRPKPYETTTDIREGIAAALKLFAGITEKVEEAFEEEVESADDEESWTSDCGEGVPLCHQQRRRLAPTRNPVGLPSAWYPPPLASPRAPITTGSKFATCLSVEP
jgi:hypothetical protein